MSTPTRRVSLVLGLVASLCAAAPAGAFEALDGDLQLHGFGEVQLRTNANDFSTSDDFDLTQWYNILNLEAEWDLVLDGWGPFSYVSAFARVEVRYDCVWQGACSLFDSVNTFGDNPDHLPARFAKGRRSGLEGTQQLEDRRLYVVDRPELPIEFRFFPVGDSRVPSFAPSIPGLETLYDNAGLDGVIATPDDPALFVFEEYFPSEGPERRKYRFGVRRTPGPQDGVGVQVLGPWRPRDKIEPLAVLANRPNPFRTGDVHPRFAAPADLTFAGFGSTTTIPAGAPLRGTGELPFRQAPDVAFTANTGKFTPRGLYIPNNQVLELLRDDDIDFANFDQNFRQEELEWNRGASQQDEKELKELYVDLEFFESRLWVRAGKQNIVWGKTELFRTTDQFNPQDLALSTLPNLEESRIPLWALRAVWAFYNVGPLNDVRLEVAANFDQFEPADIGRCGEPFSPLPVCNKTFGLFVHGFANAGLAGEVRPPDPWNDPKGIEVGARLEFRWRRFSVQISDFYGYEDMPYIDRVFTYERNVDPETGRLRRAGSRGSCKTGTEDACLQPGEDALLNHPVNQQLFAVICASSIAFSPALDPAACGLSVLGSPGIVEIAGAPAVSVATAVSTILAGGGRPGSSFNGATALAGLLGDIAFQPLASQLLVELNEDPNDCVLPTCDPRTGLPPAVRFAPGGGPQVPADLQNGNLGQFFITAAVSRFLTDEQEALIGCGPFFGTSCDIPGGGVDLMNAEASALQQSWPGFEGTFGTLWDSTDTSVWQPGTVGFDGGPVCTRYENGKTYVLPGCRGPGDDDYDPNVDGTTDGLIHPFTDPAVRAAVGLPPAKGDKLNQQFANEMAGLSWNALMGLVALSGLGEEDRTPLSVFDPDNIFADDKCSFKRPEFCENVISFFQITGVQRNIVRAGGNGRFGRRDWSWAGGSSAVLRYEKRNVLGFSMDFAEDVTKTNWSMEATWIEQIPQADQDDFDGLRDVDTYNLTISVDRPTFINFLNANRTFFFNTQVFFQYVRGWEESFTSNGPFNMLATFTINTGYFEDRLLPQTTFVWDFASGSGAMLSEIQYRFSSNFSATVGVLLFQGRWERRKMPIVPVGPIGNQAGRDAYHTFVENGLSPVRDRDELFLRLRYTF